MDSLALDVDDTCKRPIANLNRHFVHGEIIQMNTIHESNYTATKQPRNGNKSAKKLTKNSSVYRSRQARLMGWMYLMIFTQIIHS